MTRSTLPATDTRVSYPVGAVAGTATVLHTEERDGRFAVLLDETPVHAVDAAWPDQGPDRGRLSWDGTVVPLLNAVVGATDGERLCLGAEVPVRKGTDGWAFVVAHLVSVAPPVGTVVEVAVDPEHRAALSTGHTACHLASLALNRALAGLWRKEIPADALGSPDFDAAACDSSSILPHGSLDRYRLGKSLRKRGFAAAELPEQLGEIERTVNAQLADWVGTGAAVRIDRDGERLTDRRHWVCELPGGPARIACGGTHPSSLTALTGIRVALELAEEDGAAVLTMATAVPAAPAAAPAP